MSTSCAGRKFSHPSTKLSQQDPCYTNPELLTQLHELGVPHSAIPKCQNIVATADCNVRVDLKHFAQQARNVEYRPNRFCGATLRFKMPRVTVLVFKTGTIVITGAKTEADSKLTYRKVVRVLQKLGYAAKVDMSSWRLRNLVSSSVTGIVVRLEGLHHAHYQFSDYEPEIFAGCTYRILHPDVTLLLFANGKLVFVGARNMEMVLKAMLRIFPVLKEFEIPLPRCEE